MAEIEVNGGRVVYTFAGTGNNFDPWVQTAPVLLGNERGSVSLRR